MLFQRIGFSVLVVLGLSLNALAAVQIGKNFEVEPNVSKSYTIENCRGCDRAVAFWEQNLDPDDGKIVDELRVSFMKGDSVLFDAVYAFDEETNNRYISTRVRNLFPFVRKLNQNSVERFILNTEGTDTFSLPRSRN